MRESSRARPGYPEFVTLPIEKSFKPMLARRLDALPEGDGHLFEPKWDGFRALLFRDGEEWALQSRSGKPLARYFPELGPPILAQLPERCVLDGEIVIASDDGIDFACLQNRLHPAASRVAKLAAETPAAFVAWDLLCVADEDLTQSPFAERRARLEALMQGVRHPLHCTPATLDRELALDWFSRFEGAGFDGVMAKPLAGVYEPGKRSMFKVKHKRTADVVLGGFRWHKQGPGELLGSLLLGLFDEHGVLQHVGIAASFTQKRRAELVSELAPLREDALDGHPWQSWSGGAQRVPGASSRWSSGKSLAWEPLRPERVLEVSYDNMLGTRFRHTTHFVRWRPDREPPSCTYDQLEVVAPAELAQLFRRGA